jgi:hypothetical protein
MGRAILKVFWNFEENVEFNPSIGPRRLRTPRAKDERIWGLSDW